MKKIYEKPILIRAELNTEEITTSEQLSSFTVTVDSSTKTWKTIKFY